MEAGLRYCVKVLLDWELVSLRGEIPETVKWLRNRRTVHGP